MELKYNFIFNLRMNVLKSIYNIISTEILVMYVIIIIIIITKLKFCTFRLY